MFEKKWNEQPGKSESWKEITEDRVNRELAAAHGEGAADKLKKDKVLSTRFAQYRFVE